MSAAEPYPGNFENFSGDWAPSIHSLLLQSRFGSDVFIGHDIPFSPHQFLVRDGH